MIFAVPQVIGMSMNAKGDGMSKVLDLLFIEPLRFLFKVAMCCMALLLIVYCCLAIAYIIKVIIDEIWNTGK